MLLIHQYADVITSRPFHLRMKNASSQKTWPRIRIMIRVTLYCQVEVNLMSNRIQCLSRKHYVRVIQSSNWTCCRGSCVKITNHKIYWSKFENNFGTQLYFHEETKHATNKMKLIATIKRQDFNKYSFLAFHRKKISHKASHIWLAMSHNATFSMPQWTCDLLHVTKLHGSQR